MLKHKTEDFVKTANLILNRSHSNIFISLVDLNNKLIICKSSGACNVGRLKKQKKSSQAIENIMNDLVYYFEYYKIKAFNILLKVKFTNHVILLVKELVSRGYIISKLVDGRRWAHNGQRGRKFRRI